MRLRKCIDLDFDDEWQCVACRQPQLSAIDPLRRNDTRGVAVRRAAELEAALKVAGEMSVGSTIALETGDYGYARPQSRGGGSEHGFLLARVLPQAGNVAYRIADDRPGPA